MFPLASSYNHEGDDVNKNKHRVDFVKIGINIKNSQQTLKVVGNVIVYGKLISRKLTT